MLNTQKHLCCFWLVLSCLNLKSKHGSLKIPKQWLHYNFWNPPLDFSIPKYCLLLHLLFFLSSMFMNMVFMRGLLPVHHTQDMYMSFLPKYLHSGSVLDTVKYSGLLFLSVLFLAKIRIMWHLTLSFYWFVSHQSGCRKMYHIIFKLLFFNWNSYRFPSSTEEIVKLRSFGLVRPLVLSPIISPFKCLWSKVVYPFFLPVLGMEAWGLSLDLCSKLQWQISQVFTACYDQFTICKLPYRSWWGVLFHPIMTVV